MSTTRFYALNQIYNAVLTPSTVNAQYPVSNIQDDRRTKTFRSTTNSDNIVFDFGSPIEIDSFCIVDSAINGFGLATLTLELNSTNSWGAPQVSVPVTLDLVNGFGNFEQASGNFYRYARLVMTSTLGYCEISNIFFGARTQLTDNDITFPISYDQGTIAVIAKNRYGQRFIDEVGTQRKMSFSIGTLTIAEMDILFEMIENNASTVPLFIKFCENTLSSDQNRFNGMYYFTDDPKASYTQGGYWSVNMSVEEAK
jgi:hypothetical protein